MLQAASSLALATVSNKKFPSAADIVSALKSQNFFVDPDARRAGVTDTGAVYVITGESDPNDARARDERRRRVVRAATQPATGGNPKIATVQHG